MTTANLSVGINTKPAFESLALLKTELKKLASSDYSINAAALVARLEEAVSSKPLKVTLSGIASIGDLKSQLHKAVNEVITGTSRRLSIDTENLRLRVKSGIDQGVRDAKIVLGASSITVDDKIHQKVGPALSKLLNVQIPVTINESALRTTIYTAAQEALGATHSVGINAAELTTKVRNAVNLGMTGAAGKVPAGTVAAAATAAAVPSISTAEMMAALDTRFDRLISGMKDLSGPRPESTGTRRTRAAVGYSAKQEDGGTLRVSTSLPEAAKVKEQIDALNTRKQLDEEKKKADKLEADQLKQKMKDDQAAANEAFRNRRNWRNAEQQAEAAAASDRQREVNAAYQASRRFYKARQSEEAAQMRDLQQVSNDTFRARRAAARFEATRESQRLQQQMQDVYNSARFKAADSFTPRGQAIAGAAALRAQFGDERAAGFIKNSALMGEIDNLEKYRVRAATTTRSITDMMKTGHSAARGFAGALNMLWLTWGSVLPIAAGAALGGMLRSVFEVGKDVEYQLTFVSALSGNAAVSVDRFNRSLQGSMVAPKEAAEAMRALAQNGLSVQEAFTALPTILKLATVGEMGLSEAALGATGVMAAFNLQVSDLGRVSDVFAKAAAISNTSVSAMVESMKQASTVSDQYGVSLEETAATLAVLAKRNIIGTASGTAMRNMMVGISSPTEKAKDMMKQLGIEFYNAQGQLKSYTEILGILKTKTDQLDEKGKITFLNEMFTERGGKAISSLLADYNQFGETLDTLKNKSKGFTDEVTEALGQTTVGKWKSLLSEFQQVSVKTFEDAKVGARGFVDTLRLAVQSNEFLSFVQSVSNGLLDLTRYLVEHAKVIGITIAAWMGLKSVAAVASSFAILKEALVALGVAAVGAHTALLGVVSAATGGLALIGTLAAEYFLFSTRTDEATEAQRAFNNELELTNQRLRQEVMTLQEQTEMTKRISELMRQGYSEPRARDIAESEKFSARTKNLDAQISEVKRKLIEYDTWQARLNENVGRTANTDSLIRPSSVPSDSEAEQLRKTLKTYEDTRKLYQEKKGLVDAKSDADALAKRQRQLKEFNDRLYSVSQSFIREGKKDPTKGLFLVPSTVNLPDAEFAFAIDRAQKDLDDRLGKLRTRDKDAIAGDKSDLQTLNQELNLAMETMRRRQTFQRQIEETRFSSDRFGPQIAAIAAEERERRFNAEAIDVELEGLRRLGALRAKMVADKAKDHEIEAVDRAIKEQTNKYLAAREAMEQFTKLSKVKAQNEEEKQVDDFEALKRRLMGDTSDMMSKLRTKGELRLVDPVAAAFETAHLEVTKKYREETLKIEDQIARQRAGMSELSGDALKAAQRQLETDEERLTVLRELGQQEANNAGTLAARLEAQTRTAEYGFQKFWTEYVNTGKASADMMYEIMKSSTTKIEDALTELVMTGKTNFRSLVNSILADVVRMMMHQQMVKLMGLFGGSLLGNGGAGTSAWGYSESFMSGIVNSANGNVVTSSGPIPLKYFSSGGIARKPMVSIFGEGSTAEAYVPLPDGRSIPVTMRGGGASNVKQDISVTVNVQGGQTNAETGQVVSRAVVETMRGIARGEIANSRRPGGVLYAG